MRTEPIFSIIDVNFSHKKQQDIKTDERILKKRKKNKSKFIKAEFKRKISVTKMFALTRSEVNPPKKNNKRTKPSKIL